MHITNCDVVHMYGIFRSESLSDLLTLLKNMYVNIARSYNTPGDRIVPPPWRGAGRFVAWLSTSVSNYSKAGSCLWAAAPVPGVLMMSFFLRILLSTDLEAGVTVRSVRHLNHYWRCFLIPVGWVPGISDGRKITGSSSVLFLHWGRCLRPYQTVRLRSSRHHVGRWWGR